MKDEGSMVRGRTWNAITAGILLLAIALGVVLYIQTRDVFDAVWTILIVFGIYMAVSSVAMSRDEDGFGPSEADMAVVGGSLIAGIGVAGLVYSFTDEVLYTVVIIIAIVAIVGIIMSIKNRNV